MWEWTCNLSTSNTGDLREVGGSRWRGRVWINAASRCLAPPPVAPGPYKEIHPLEDMRTCSPIQLTPLYYHRGSIREHWAEKCLRNVWFDVPFSLFVFYRVTDGQIEKKRLERLVRLQRNRAVKVLHYMYHLSHDKAFPSDWNQTRSKNRFTKCLYEAWKKCSENKKRNIYIHDYHM